METIDQNAKYTWIPVSTRYIATFMVRPSTEYADSLEQNPICEAIVPTIIAASG